ncbi:MAG: phospholipase D-like domain-containing protein [Candidatus Saccharimonadales bacterium]
MFQRNKLPVSKLYDQNTFYRAFTQDLGQAKKSVLIESPFITAGRVRKLLPMLRILRKEGVQIVINTRNPQAHEGSYQQQAAEAVALFHELDIVVLYTVGHHRKLAIIDGKTIWEGSLNILSFSDSCEIMRRITSKNEAKVLTDFIKLNEFLEV